MLLLSSLWISSSLACKRTGASRDVREDWLEMLVFLQGFRMEDLTMAAIIFRLASGSTGAEVTVVTLRKRRMREVVLMNCIFGLVGFELEQEWDSIGSEGW